MTVILVDKTDRNLEVQLANLTWDCIVTNLENEEVVDTKSGELLRVGSVGQLGEEDAKQLAITIKEKFLPQISICEVLFIDGRIGKVTVTGDGLSLDTPNHLASYVTRGTLERLQTFLSGSTGFDVL